MANWLTKLMSGKVAVKKVLNFPVAKACNKKFYMHLTKI